MKQYDCVRLNQDFKGYKKGTKGVIVELYEDGYCYVELFTEDNESIDLILDVPLSSLTKIDD